MSNNNFNTGNKTVEGIILAAGFSRRAGTNKMTMQVNGKPLLARCIENMYDICSKIIVVGGYKAEDIHPIIVKYKNVSLIINENYENGMFSSVKKGIEYIKGDRFFLTPGDYPAIQSRVYKDMSAIGGDVIIPTYKGKRGHPILINGKLIDKICTNANYHSLRDFINDYGFITIEISDEGILMDVDTPNDYNTVCRYLSI